MIFKKSGGQFIRGTKVKEEGFHNIGYHNGSETNKDEESYVDKISSKTYWDMLHSLNRNVSRITLLPNIVVVIVIEVEGDLKI